MDTGTAVAFAMVALGGALGAMTRYGISRMVDSSAFPMATFIANIIACTLVSFVVFRFAG
ncbi:MAG: CrcB family protein, partial [Candidatus Methanomethylophilaceae archaeon]